MSDPGRRRARARTRERKDKVLHARIPDQLDRELRRRAGRLGLSVSTVVRNVLLHTFDLVEGIVSDGAQIARALGDPDPREQAPPARREPSRPKAPAVESALGWQEAILNVNAVCERCNRVLKKGARAAIGVPVSARPVFLCRGCLSSLGALSREGPAGAPGRAVPRVRAPGATRSRRR